jgi:nucleoside 2-deoxyribosyltransferase
MELLGRASRGQISEPTFREKRAAMLDWIRHESRLKTVSPYGATVTLNKLRDYAVAWCHDTRQGYVAEWMFIFKPLVEQGLILDIGDNKVQITNKGWEYLESRPSATGAQGFIAMAFKEMDAVHEAIAAAVVAAGYKPLRIDGHEFVGGIMDEILARIRESRFVIADLTLNRGGVYHEAGFALGLNIPVIPTCRQDHIDGAAELRVHFDMQHLNLISWTPDKLPELTTRLMNRIEAILGRGPL